VLSSTHRTHQPSNWSGGATLAMIFAMLLAAASGSLLRADGGSPALAHRSAQSFSWSPSQVRELIGLIEESERQGFDPSRYGLAALQSELEQCALLWGNGRCNQLNTLSRTSALALAADYRKRQLHGHYAPVSEDQLEKALVNGQLRNWLITGALTPGGRFE